MNSKYVLLIYSIVFFAGCQSQEHYIYEEIKPEVELYLSEQMFNNFGQSDTLIVYDTNYFNNMIMILSTYQDKLVVEDSTYNHLISDRLALVEEQQIQKNQPDIYLPFQALMDNFEKDKTNTDKIMVWLEAVPKQIEAGKVQLEKPNTLQTKLAIEQLKKAYGFVSNDLKVHLQQTDRLEKNNDILEMVKFAIKDYLAFLNSKLINEETK